MEMDWARSGWRSLAASVVAGRFIEPRFEGEIGEASASIVSVTEPVSG